MSPKRSFAPPFRQRFDLTEAHIRDHSPDSKGDMFKITKPDPEEPKTEDIFDINKSFPGSEESILAPVCPGRFVFLSEEFERQQFRKFAKDRIRIPPELEELLESGDLNLDQMCSNEEWEYFGTDIWHPWLNIEPDWNSFKVPSKIADVLHEELEPPIDDGNDVIDLDNLFPAPDPPPIRPLIDDLAKVSPYIHLPKGVRYTKCEIELEAERFWAELFDIERFINLQKLPLRRKWFKHSRDRFRSKYLQ